MSGGTRDLGAPRNLARHSWRRTGGPPKFLLVVRCAASWTKAIRLGCPNVVEVTASVIILSLRPVRPMRPDAQDGKCIFRDDPQTWPAQRQLLGCIIPGCSRQFHRSDALGNHLRKKHLLPIPKGQWAKSWISRVENHHYYNAAVQAQLRENSGV